MPTSVKREDVQRLLTSGASLVEVLPDKEYEEEHIPGAIHISLEEMNIQTTGQLGRDQPIVVYCWDYQ